MKILVTGGFGCIGAEATKWLVRNTSAQIIVASRSVSDERSTRVFHDVDRSNLSFLELDVRNQQQLERVLVDECVTDIVHMAAFQSPDCNTYRDEGLQINVAGTQNLIEAVKATKTPLRRFLFASSIAVYGPRTMYSGPIVPMNAQPMPVNVYGAWKIAGESLTRIFHEETGVTAISIRPGVLFGPGRDSGLTSTPTKAMKCVALGMPYDIPFTSRQDYQFAPDVGQDVGLALTEAFTGYGMFTLPSHTVDSVRFVDAIRDAADRLGVSDRFQIGVGSETVPFSCEIEYEPFCRAFPRATQTPFGEAVERTLEVYLRQVELGWLTRDAV